MNRLSGLQKDVLKLYKQLLKSVLIKSNNNKSIPLYALVKREFRAKAQSISKNDYRTIEHLLRNGYKQKKLIEMPGFTTATTVTSYNPHIIPPE